MMAFCVNLYTDATARCALPSGNAIKLEMQTRYPHEGQVRLKIVPDKPARLAVYLRIPAWCETATVKVGAEPIASAKPGIYHRIDRQWSAGDEINLDLSMKPAVVPSPPEVLANRGQLAFRRGPLIYCLEKQDAAGLDLEKVSLVLDSTTASQGITEKFNSKLGMHVIEVQTESRESDRTTAQPQIQLIPFFFRANRAPDSRWITWIPCGAGP